MTERRPWNRMRKAGVVILACGAVAFIIGLVTHDAAWQIIGPVLVIVAILLNLASIPSSTTDQLDDRNIVP